ncbi:MAG: CNNM domain-containing protein [Desulfobacterales bacterium]|nr:CNNM domain-containing protein [Desulfobacterales bacterium]
MVLLFIYIFIALFFSFACSLMEAVFLSIPYSYVALLKKDNGREGRRLHRLKENTDKSLSAILSLNTIAHTVGAAGAGAQATAVFGNQYVGIISAVLTLLILVVSEIIPKSLGATHWRRLAKPVALCLEGLILIMYPFVWASQYITRLFSSKDQTDTFCKDEFTAMAELGESSGKLRKEEGRILRSLFRFNTLTVKDIMTPRTVVFALNDGMTVQELARTHTNIIFSRIPVFSETIDTLTGYVMKDEILEATARDEFDTRLSTMKRDIQNVSEEMRLPDLYNILLDQRAHICAVKDSYGGTAGIVTMEDLVETLLGMEIMDELDVDRDMQALARDQWQKRVKQQR